MPKQHSDFKNLEVTKQWQTKTASKKYLLIGARKQRDHKLQRPWRYADQVQSNIKQQKKKYLQGDVEKLKVAYVVN